MDAITLTLAKAYADSQRVAYTETPAPITFNGDASGKTVNDFGVKIIDEIVDVTTVTSVEVMRNGTLYSFGKESLSVSVSPDGTVAYLLCADMEDAIVVATVVGDGTYLFYTGDTVYCTKVNFAETIHPIDPKYLPGAVLPVVELSEATTAALLENGTASANENECAILTAVSAKPTPIIVNLSLEGVTMFSFLANRTFDASLDYYGMVAEGVQISVAQVNDGDGWVLYLLTSG